MHLNKIVVINSVEKPNAAQERILKGVNFLAGHLRYWKSFNENIRRDAKRFLKKIKNRP